MPECLICSGSNVTVFFDDSDDSLDTTKMGSSRTRLSPGTIVRCQTCGFAFRQQRFNEEELAGLYRKMDHRVYQAELPGRMRTADVHLAIVNRSVPPNGGPRHLLDVGCASGVFLEKALASGWQVAGIEPSEVLYKEAMERIGAGGTVFPLTFEEADFGGRKFDAITLWDVLEHVTGPMNILRHCCELLKPGGCLLLNVPDLDSFEARFLGRRWPLLLPEHLNYFNRPSLKLGAEKAGLELVRFGRRKSHFSVGYVLYRLSQHSIPGAKLFAGAAKSAVGKIIVPLSLGETYAVFRRPA